MACIRSLRLFAEAENINTKAAAVDAKDGKIVDAPAEAVTEGKKPRVALPATAPATTPQARKKPEKS